MSSDADAAAATVSLFDSIYTGRYCNMAASALFFYDAAITFDREVACYWASKQTGAAFLFLANKWISMTLYVMTLISFASFPTDQVVLKPSPSVPLAISYQNQSCSVLQNANQALVILQFVPGAVFSALRAYVLSRNKLLGIFVLALSLAPVGSNLVEYGRQLSGGDLPPFGCLYTDNMTQAIELLSKTVMYRMVLTVYLQGVVIVISRVPLIIADMSLIYITWTTLSRRDNLRDLRKSKRPSLQGVLFCNGTIYFVVLFALNTLHLVFSLTTLLTEEGTGISYFTQFTTPLTSILISHFLLALQEANQVVVRVDPDDPLHTSRYPWDDTPSIIFSLGAFIDPDRPARSADNMEWDIDSHREEEGGAEVVEVQAAETLSPPSSVTAAMLSATIAASSSLAAAPSSSSV